MGQHVCVTVVGLGGGVTGEGGSLLLSDGREMQVSYCQAMFHACFTTVPLYLLVHIICRVSYSKYVSR